MIIMYLHTVNGQKILEKSSGQKTREINFISEFSKKKEIREMVFFL